MLLKPSASRETFVQLETIPNLVKILNKLNHSRSNEERDRIVKALEKTNYFKDFISNPEQRSEFIQAMAYHVEYKYFPKGAAVCQQGDFDARFGIIINGRAIVYTQKTVGEHDEDVRSKNTRECYHIYRKFLESNEFTKKFKRWAQTGFQNAENKLLLTIKKIVKKQTTAEEAAPTQTLNQLDIKKLIATVLEDSDSIIPSDKKLKDLSFEDKLLLLNCNSNNEKYFKNGVALYKKCRELRGGDCIAETALTIDMITENTIIATEDLHIITLKQQHFRELFQQSAYFQEKRDFLATVFPTLSQEVLFKLCAYTEEKLVVNRDYIYKQGESAEAIYIIRSGEVELVTYEGEEEEVEKVPNSFFLKSEPKKKFQTKHRVIAGVLKTGSVLGEDEVIAKLARKYSAVSKSAALTLYTLKRQVYYDIFERYVPCFGDVFKSNMKTRQEWRQDRITKEQIVFTQLSRKRDLSADDKNHKTQRAIKNTPLAIESEYFQFEPTKPEAMPPRPLSRSIVRLESQMSRTVRQKVEIRVYSSEHRQASLNSREETPTSRLMQANASLSKKFLKAKKNLHRVHRSITGISETMMQTSRSKEMRSPKAPTAVPVLSRNEINEKINMNSPNMMQGSSVFNSEKKRTKEDFVLMNSKLSESVREKEKKGPIIPSIQRLKSINSSAFWRNRIMSENNDSIVIQSTTSRGSLKNSLENSIENIKEEKEVKTREKSYHLYKRILASQPKKKSLVVAEGFLVHDSRSFTIKSLNKL